MNGVIKKAGKLKAIKMFIDKSGHIITKISVEFMNGTFSYQLKLSDYKNKFLFDFIQNYNLGVCLNDVSFYYIDNENLIGFKCSVFRYNYILPELIISFEKNRKDTILNLFSGMEMIPLIDNHISNDFISENAPNSFINEDIFDEYKEEMIEVCSNIKNQEISLSENIVVLYNNDWSNEGYYGPQNVGGFSRLDDLFRNSGFEDYDYSLFDLEDEEYNCKWDENTVISLLGPGSELAEVLVIETNLKNIKWFESIAETEIFHSGIQYDIRSLCNTSYETHEEQIQKSEYSHLYLMPAEEILTQMEELEDFYQVRMDTMRKCSREIKGAKA